MLCAEAAVGKRCTSIAGGPVLGEYQPPAVGGLTDLWNGRELEPCGIPGSLLASITTRQLWDRKNYRLDTMVFHQN